MRLLRVPGFLLLGLALSMGLCPGAAAQSPTLGGIYLVPYTFSPRGFAECNGQLLPIAQNTALFSLLGTTYGGDGKTTFALPDLRDRVPIGAGQGPGLTLRDQGEMGGEASHVLTVEEMPAHTHPLNAVVGLGSTVRPGAMLPADDPRATYAYASGSTANAAPSALGASGEGRAHNNRQPYLGLKYVIALVGIFPSRP